MKGTIRVDAAELRRLGTDLVTLADQLNADTDALGDGVADSCLAMALNDVQHDWSKKRKLITGYLTNAGQAARNAADAYRQTDHAIGCAATPGRAR
jgi:hypothetical protein